MKLSRSMPVPRLENGKLIFDENSVNIHVFLPLLRKLQKIAYSIHQF